MPRTVTHAPFVQIAAPIAWSTLALTLHADGRVDHEVVGASPFPRHWVYGPSGDLVGKTGLIDMKGWARHAFGPRTPWGGLDSPALAVESESALERQLSAALMGGTEQPRIRRFRAGRSVLRQGDLGDELLVLLDGVLIVEVDGDVVTDLGPGSVLGERALLEGGRRTATVRARTAVTIATVSRGSLAPSALVELRDGHQREREMTQVDRLADASGSEHTAR